MQEYDTREDSKLLFDLLGYKNVSESCDVFANIFQILEAGLSIKKSIHYLDI